MLRSLVDLANATPPEYESYTIADPRRVASAMVAAAGKFRFEQRAGITIDSKKFLVVGPGSGRVIAALLDLEQQAHGLETSRRGISKGPELTRSYVLWGLPWESPFAMERMSTSEADGGARHKPFSVTALNRNLEKLLTPEEWKATIIELKRISNYVAVV